MPPYDPKAKRPKLVPVDDDDAAPVDALLGGDAAATATASTAAAPTRPRLSVVTDEEPSPRPVDEPVAVTPSGGFDAKVAVLVAAVVAVTVGVVVVLRRR